MGIWAQIDQHPVQNVRPRPDRIEGSVLHRLTADSRLQSLYVVEQLEIEIGR